MMDGWSMYGGDGWVAMVLVFAFIGAVVAVLVVALGHGHAPPRTPPSLPDGTDAEADLILQRRFAAGEITEDEFLQRRSLLHDRPW